MDKIAAIAAIALGLGGCIADPFQAQATGPRTAARDWPVYGGEQAQNHYSSLTQINRKNVRNLVVAWKFDSGEKGGLEVNPVVVGSVLYGYTPHNIIALDAASGRLLWRFDPDPQIEPYLQSRGVAYWTDGHERRVFAGVNHFLYALDASTGKPISSFGEDGKIDLRKGLRGDYRLQSVSLTTPGTIYKDLIIVGGANPESHPAPPGDIRAFDVRTGALRWTFHTIPRPGEFGYDTWPKDAWEDAGAANNWAGMTVDGKRGIVYVPTGSAVFDFYGGDRIGDDLFADSLIALDAKTGKRLWHFQGVHHDLWDRDFPAAPVLITIKHDGKQVQAVAQTTKQGFLYLFDRVTGEPLFPIKESNYPPSNVPGEVASPTQPLPTAPPPYTRQAFTEDMLTNRTPEAHAWAVKQFKTLISGGQFIPPSVDKLTLVMPGFGGGAEWGGPAVDPTTNVLYVNVNDVAWLVGLTVPPPAQSLGERVYQSQCSVCHGVDRAGSPPTVPSLVGIGGLLTEQEITDKIHQGGGRMPAFSNLNGEQVEAVVHFLTKVPLQHARHPQNGQPETAFSSAPPASQAGAIANDMPYNSFGFRRFLDPEGYPAVTPPWGTLNAIDLNTGKYLWKIPLGEYPALAAQGIRNTGTENFGGPIVTAGGVLFIGATVFDQKFRAFDSSTGELLWEADLPFPGMATPSTYMVNGKQYVVIASGGGGQSSGPSGGVYVAFALP